MINAYRPESIDELLKILDQETCHIFAGGTDLMIRKRQWQGAERKFTQSVAYIIQLEELRGIWEDENFYEIGTLTTQTDIVESNLPEYIKEPYRLMSSPAIRNVATVGGNIVNAAAVADSLPILYALDAQVELMSIDGVRRIPVEDFVVGKYRTLRKDNELLTKVIVPKYEASGYFYKKLGQRKASILSKVSVFILYQKSDVRIAIGAINDTVIRSKSIEYAFMNDLNISDMMIGYQGLMSGKDDKRSTKNYRETVAINLIQNYLKEIVDEL